MRDASGQGPRTHTFPTKMNPASHQQPSSWPVLHTTPFGLQDWSQDDPALNDSFARHCVEHWLCGTHTPEILLNPGIQIHKLRVHPVAASQVRLLVHSSTQGFEHELRSSLAFGHRSGSGIVGHSLSSWHNPFIRLNPTLQKQRVSCCPVPQVAPGVHSSLQANPVVKTSFVLVHWCGAAGHVDSGRHTPWIRR